MASDDRLTAELAVIRQREQAATPGPWAWFGNTDTHNIYLATRQWGRFIVMGFRRWGTQGARPMFATGRTWKPAPKSDLDFGPAGRMTPASEMFTGKGEMADADSLAVYAVAPDATSRRDPRVYRADLSGIRNPDAEFIAHSRQDLSRLLALAEAVTSLCRDTEGNWLDPTSELPVGEFQAAISDALVPEADRG